MLPDEIVAKVICEYLVDPELRAEGHELLNDTLQTQLRGTIAGMSWAARQGRVDLAAPASICASASPTPKVQDARSANAAVVRAKAHNVEMKIWAIKESDLRRVCIQESSFDPRKKERSQHGWIRAYSTPALAADIEAPLSIVSWNWKKLRRKADSSLLCEAQSACISVGKWLQATVLEMSLRFADYDRRDPLYHKQWEPPTVLSKKKTAAVDPAGLLIMDAKSLFDTLLT